MLPPGLRRMALPDTRNLDEAGIGNPSDSNDCKLCAFSRHGGLIEISPCAEPRTCPSLISRCADVRQFVAAGLDP